MMFMLLIQVEEEWVVDNCIYDCFCEICVVVGYFCEGGKLLVIKGVYYEIFFEKDVMCLVVFNVIVEFFNKFNLFSGNCFVQRLNFIMYQVVVFDLDGMLFFFDYMLFFYVKEILKLLIVCGIYFVFVIGCYYVDVG